MEEDNQWLQPLKVRIAELSSLTTFSICRVPTSLRLVNEEAYLPRLISIGPLHYGKLKSMEVLKLHYMLSLLIRTQDAEETLDRCGKAIKDLDEAVRACYAEPIEYSKEELAQILLVDGCFIIELFLRYYYDHLKLPNDFVFESSWIIPNLQHDLLLLENQIPFIVFEFLFKNAVVPSTEDSYSLSSLPTHALTFFKPVLHPREERFRISRTNFPHLLGLIHNYYLPTDPGSRRERCSVKSASALNGSGIQFENDSTKKMFDLKFQSGVLKIPSILVHEKAVPVFQNLIAYEQLVYCGTHYVTSYFSLMAQLVKTVQDAELLKEKSILEEDLVGLQDVPDLFSKMCKKVFLKDFYYAELCENVSKYRKKRWYVFKIDGFRYP